MSAASLADGEFWRMLEERIRKTRIEPGTLSFEFPEEAACGHIAMIAPFMCRLREQGISFALDNFGRAVGSLSNLNALPVSCIKIDGSFSRDLDRQCQIAVDAGGDRATREDVRSGDRGRACGDRCDPRARARGWGWTTARGSSSASRWLWTMRSATCRCIPASRHRRNCATQPAHRPARLRN